MTNSSTMKECSQLPLVSVILPVYNGVPYLREAIESVLRQTYFDFELIIINDGSTDDSEGIIESFDDSRIRYYSQGNQGLPATLNHGIGLARGELIARQDQDDVSLPLRFERQVEYFMTHPCCGMLGTWAEIWVDDARTERAHRHPPDNALLQFGLLFNNPFVHSSVMIRRVVFNKVGLYCTDNSRQPPEDYELWSRVSREFEVANIPEIHLIYREVQKSMSRSGVNPFLARVVNISAENLAWMTGRSATDTAVRDLAAFSHGAAYLVSSRPRIAELTILLREATEMVCRRVGADEYPVAEAAVACLRSVRYQYLLHRFGGLLGRTLANIDAFIFFRGRH